MAKKVARTIKNIAKRGFERTARFLGQDMLSALDRASSANQASQILLNLRFKELLHRGERLPSFDDVEFRTFSQNGEDGILLFLFSILGMGDRTLLDLGSGNCLVGNCTNLLVNHGWTGVLADGSAASVEIARDFFARCKDTTGWRPQVVEAWIDAENVNGLVAANGLSGSIDLLSIDLDGNDLWIWKALQQVQPRVVVLEYLDILGPDRSWSIPYKPDFVGEYDEWGLYYGGASLRAFVNISRRKGYRLVGCQRYGYNAFFVRNDVGPDVLPEVTVESCFRHPRVRDGMRDRLSQVIDKPWVEIE